MLSFALLIHCFVAAQYTDQLSEMRRNEIERERESALKKKKQEASLKEKEKKEK